MTWMKPERERLKTLLADLGLVVSETRHDGVCVLDGAVRSVFSLDAEGNLSLTCSVRCDHFRPDLAKVNAANRRLRFVRFSVRPHLLVLAADFVIGRGEDVSSSCVRNVLRLWRAGIDELRSLISDFALA